MFTFPERLMRILRTGEHEDSIRWCDDGKSFAIFSAVLSKKVLPLYFEGTKMESFNRNLNRWGFERIYIDGFSPQASVYRHTYFQKECPKLLSYMKRGQKSPIVILEENSTTNTLLSAASELLKLRDFVSSNREGNSPRLPIKKRRRLNSEETETTESDEDVSTASVVHEVSDNSDESGSEDYHARIRPHQAGLWALHYQHLCEYKKEHGHCFVAHAYKGNPSLARWVKRQRYQYTLLQEGRPTNMTQRRVKTLESIGFVWDSQAAVWMERFNELKAYRRIHKHCNVPTKYQDNMQLARWVKCQRRQYKLYQEGQLSNITASRIEELESIGFSWQLRSYRGSASSILKCSV